MMLSELIEPLNSIARACEFLSGEVGGLLNVYQERVVTAIQQVTGELHEMLISLPDLNSTNTQVLLSYETRSHLASIIGYAEVLLDEEDGTLTAVQSEQVQRIRSEGKGILSSVMRLIEEG